MVPLFLLMPEENSNLCKTGLEKIIIKFNGGKVN